MRGQSNFIVYIFALVIVVLLLIPMFFYLTDISSLSEKQLDLGSIVREQVNGGGVVIYFNSSNKQLYSSILVYRGDSNFTLVNVYYTNGSGVWFNITNDVCVEGQFHLTTNKLPQPLIYNFSITTKSFNYPLVLMIRAYNQTEFVQVLPNETAVA
ncbi:hypothetical protein HS7_13060 [Sulfolobales archaeon HS-7]|nr:hypothetical protein HS7_13060 [Sulfolobales archaeon HS-7]